MNALMPKQEAQDGAAYGEPLNCCIARMLWEGKWVPASSVISLLESRVIIIERHWHIKAKVRAGN